MKASDLIKHLSQLIALHGDLEVKLCDHVHGIQRIVPVVSVDKITVSCPKDGAFEQEEIVAVKIL